MIATATLPAAASHNEPAEPGEAFCETRQESYTTNMAEADAFDARATAQYAEADRREATGHPATLLRALAGENVASAERARNDAEGTKAGAAAKCQWVKDLAS